MSRATMGRLLAVVVALGIVGLGAWWMLPPPSLMQRARDAYARGQWSKARELGLREVNRPVHDPAALQLVARCDAQMGGPAALAAYAAIDPASLTADDFLLIGRRLIEQGRAVLGAAALETAVKLDLRHREARATLAAENDRLNSQGDVVRQLDRFRAVENGRALAVLVAGILRLGRPPAAIGGFDPWVDKVVARDRASLARLDEPGVQKLLVRFLLEDGRHDEARTLLKGIPASDREAAWLLSRVELDAGHVEAATAALDRAGDFGRDDPLAHEPARYAGARRCAECHGAIYRSQQSSRHALTLGMGNALETVPFPNGPVVDPARSDVVHTFERNGRDIRVTARVGNETVRAAIDYALGSGHHGVTMVGRDEMGVSRALRISYYTGGKAWEITNGYDLHPPVPADYLGKALSDEGLRTCLDCHTTRFRSPEDRQGPEAADRGIGCEKCHGPSSRHLSAVEHGFPQLAIARPKLATPARRMILCSPCHGADGIIPPSDPRFVRFQSTTLPFSKCFTGSGGRVDCVACHSPHHDVSTDPASYEARCLACHEPQAPKSDPSLRLDPVKGSVCPVNPRSGCIGCHMPKSEKVIPFTAFTDHHIRVHRTAALSSKSAGP